MAYQVDDYVMIRNANLGDLTVQIIDIDNERYPVKYYGSYFVDGVRQIITFYSNDIIGYANNNNNNSSVASNSTGDPSNLSNNNLMNLNSNNSQNGGRSRRRRKNRRRSRRSRRR